MPITAVLSAFNNEFTISNVVLQTLAHAHRVIVVDDGSTDNTAEKARLAGAEVIRHNINLGKKAALRTGFALAARNGARVIVTMDSDGRHDPADIGKLAEPILRGEADLVKGNYNGSAGGITDTHIDFRAFSRKCFDHLITEGNILTTIHEKGLKVIEVQIGSNGSKDQQSQGTTRKFTIAAMPAYNEERSIAKMVLLSRKYADMVVVVDDGSTDSTADIAQAMGAHVIRHPENRGYGGALRTCFETARDLAADRMVILDSDGQHDPAQIPELVEPLNVGFDVVIGSRFINGNGKNVPIFRKIGMKVLDAVTNIGGKIKVSDTQSGLRAYGRKAIEKININTNNMSAGSEILMQINDHRLKIKEVEIHCSYDVERASTQNPVSHGIGVLLGVLKQIEFKKPLYFLTLPGIILSLSGFGLGIFLLESKISRGILPFGPTLLMILIILIGVFSIFTGIILHSISALFKNLKFIENKKT
ncbi:MAG: glycosyltransferase family 2 protein [Candidatus Methanoperedens sp.]|nr:glycosyltransferase family 2 protein [Candidatus Methanoperedens sp.]